MTVKVAGSVMNFSQLHASVALTSVLPERNVGEVRSCFGPVASRTF